MLGENLENHCIMTGKAIIDALIEQNLDIVLAYASEDKWLVFMPKGELYGRNDLMPLIARSSLVDRYWAKNGAPKERVNSYVIQDAIGEVNHVIENFEF